MNLTTHMFLAFAAGIVVFHNVGIALIMAIGAMIPDLDREYFFIAKKFYAQYLLQRAVFHNVFVIAALYFFNPFLALGALTHAALDSFTSASDRGVELFFPLTRLVKCYFYDINGGMSGDPKYRQWWVEDPWTLLRETTDRDLQEPTHQPWRRSYGPFKNGRIVDWALFFSSIIFLVVLGFGNSGLYSFEGHNLWLYISFIAIGTFYGLGELYRRKLAKPQQEKLYLIRQMSNPADKEKAIQQMGNKTIKEMLSPTGLAVLAGLIIGIAVFIYGGIEAGIFVLKLPSNSILLLSVYGLVSLVIGFVIASLFLMVYKNRDKSM